VESCKSPLIVVVLVLVVDVFTVSRPRTTTSTSTISNRMNPDKCCEFDTHAQDASSRVLGLALCPQLFRPGKYFRHRLSRELHKWLRAQRPQLEALRASFFQNVFVFLLQPQIRIYRHCWEKRSLRHASCSKH
jgi:hypothetical protein